MHFESFKKQYNYDSASGIIKQYLDIKFAHLDCILLFRIGEFYELFYEDAVLASKILGIALTTRGKNRACDGQLNSERFRQDEFKEEAAQASLVREHSARSQNSLVSTFLNDAVPMCGVPYHSLSNYLNKLIEAGSKIAICEQIDTPEEDGKRKGRTIITRQVVRIITPGTILEESLAAPEVPNYLASLSLSKTICAICYVDLTTSELNIIEVPVDQIISQLSALVPKELLLPERLRNSDLAHNIKTQLKIYISFQADSFFEINKCEEIIVAFYKIAGIKAIGDLSPLQISALGSILGYIALTQKQNILKLQFPKIINYQNFMTIDAATRRNLEITVNQNGSLKGSLFSAIDRTITKAGSRLLYKFLYRPLLDVNQINKRLSFTEFFYNNFALSQSIRKLLKTCGDLEKILARISMNRSGPRDLLSIQSTLETALAIKLLFINEFGIEPPYPIAGVVKALSGDGGVIELIKESIREEAPHSLIEGGFIRPDYHARIKGLYDLINNNKAHVEKLKVTYQNITDVDSLKILHNNVLGLYIEVASKNVHKMTDERFIHRQTTSNSARFATKELQDLESEIVNAKNNAINLEKGIFKEICDKILEKTTTLLLLADALKTIDVFCSFGVSAKEYGYCKPQVTDDIYFELKDARHPVLEQIDRSTNDFTPNDCMLSYDQRIWLLTGPNMSGKSTFLRQNALIAVLAQIGSFVPASYAKIGIVDKIFSRIGAGDDLLKGSSTFMVEMLEVSAILSQATEKSLVILDEVGRGTSTYDGVSIAWAVLEHVHNDLKCRCLFATHYFELTALDQFLTALKNYTIAIKELDGTILFLHKIIEGTADKSYGIHVASLAGIPSSVTNRANEILLQLQQK
jgi:DNA mismatch repair protein MutS